MPGRDQDGAFSVVLCTSEGLKTVLLDAQGNPVAPEHGDETASVGPCVFASVHVLDLPRALPTPAGLASVDMPVARASGNAVWIGLQRHANGARAPPVFVQHIV